MKVVRQSRNVRPAVVDSESEQRFLSPPLRISGMYLLFGIAWILLSDFGMLWSNLTSLSSYLVSISKGLLFVFASAGLIYVLLRHYVRTSYQNHSLVHAVVDNTTDAVFVKDREGKYLIFNKAASSLFGKPTADVVGRRDVDVFDDPELKTLKEIDRKVVEDGRSQLVEHHLDSGKHQRTISTSKAPLWNDQGDIVGLVAVSRDVSEARQVADELRAERDRLAGIMEAIPAILCAYQRHPDGRITMPFASPRILSIYDIPAEQLADDATPLFQVIHPDDIERVQASIEESAKTMSLWRNEFRVLNPTRGEIWVEGCSSPIELADGSILWNGYVADVTDRHRTEKQLLQFQVRLEAAQRIARLGSWSWNALENKAWWSEAVFSIYGFEPQDDPPAIDEFIARVHVDDRAKVTRRLKAVQNGADGFADELKLQLPDGSTKWVYSVGHAVRDENGKLVQIDGVDQDISRLREAQIRQQLSEERLRVALEGASGGAWDWDTETGIAWWSPEMYELWGVTPGTQMILENSTAVIHKDDLQYVESAIQDALATQSDYTAEFRIHHKTRGERWILSSGRLMGRTRLVGISLDITERKRAAIELQRSQEFVQKVASSSLAGVYVFDIREVRVVFINQTFQDLLGYDADDLADFTMSDFLDLFDERDRPQVLEHAGLLRDAKDHEVYELECRVRAKSGDWVWCLVRDSVFARDAANRTSQIVGSFLDITDRKRLEEQLLHAQKMEAVGRLAGGIAHDFNNLLTVINGYSELLLETPLEPDQQAESLTAVLDAGQRAAELTRQLLTFSRRAIITPQILDLNELVLRNDRLLRRLIGEDIQLETISSSVLCPVEGDQSQLDQVVLNLALNARDAMPDGGSIRIEVRPFEVAKATTVATGQLKSGRYARLSITDDGDGMDELTSQQLFEPFYSTKAPGQGTGLGLAVVHGIVAQSGGQIAVENSAGQGCSFHVFLPLAENAVGHPLPSPGTIETTGTETILVVEDEAAVRQICETTLTACGYTVISAANGSDALEAASNCSRHIDLLITDLVMPGMNGLELAARLNQGTSHLPILYMSGYSDDTQVQQKMRQAAHHFLQKPFSPTDLAARVRLILNETASTASLNLAP